LVVTLLGTGLIDFIGRRLGLLMEYLAPIPDASFLNL
jgi:hypothetical protein